MEENKISAEEIISKHAGFKINANTRGGCLTFEDCFAAMEEYAAQFKQQSAGVWVKASEGEPRKDGYYFCKHRMYKSDLNKVYQFRDGEWYDGAFDDEGNELKIAKHFEWLDESQQSQEQSKPDDIEFMKGAIYGANLINRTQPQSLTDEAIEKMINNKKWYLTDDEGNATHPVMDIADVKIILKATLTNRQQDGWSDEKVLDLLHYIGREGYHINGYDDSMLLTVIANYKTQVK